MGCRFAHEGKVAGWKQRQAVERRSFLKKKPKNFYKFRLSLCGKAEASLARVFCFFFSRKKAFRGRPYLRPPTWALTKKLLILPASAFPDRASASAQEYDF
jgi:hypothetical protein